MNGRLGTFTKLLRRLSPGNKDEAWRKLRVERTSVGPCGCRNLSLGNKALFANIRLYSSFSQLPRDTELPPDPAANLEEEEEDSHQWRYAPDNSFITRNNRKWLTKKRKKDDRVKSTLTYKEIRDKTYDEIAEVFPQIHEFDRDEVKKLMAEGAMYGFSPTKVAKILSRYPEFIDEYTTLLPNSTKAWRALGFTESDRVTMFHRHPNLMALSATTVAKGYSFLQQYFSNKELVFLFKNCPEVIVQDEALLEEKINLLWKQYSHSSLSIAKSDSMSSDVQRIRVRHEFLIRAGLFKPMLFHKFLKFQAECDRRRMVKERDGYMMPADIVCTSDEKFLDLCTKKMLSLTDLVVFEVLLKKEEEDSEIQSAFELDEKGLENLYAKESGPEDELEEDDSNEKYESSLPSIHQQPWRYSSIGSNSAATFNEVDNIEFYF